MKSFVFASLVIFCANSAWAYDLKTCESLARAGLVDTRDVTMVQERASNDFDYVCQENVDRVSRASSRSGGGSVGYAGFSVGYSSAKGQSDASERINNICSEGKSAFLEKSIRKESVRSAGDVVDMIESCLEILTDNNSEALLGYTTPSLNSDSFFTMHFRFNPGKDAPLRTYSLTRADVDPEADLHCWQGDTNIDIASGDIVVKGSTSMSCSKVSGLSVNGILAFKASDDSTGERLVHFRVNSTQGEVMLRNEIAAEYQARLDTLQARLDRQISVISGELSARADGETKLKNEITVLGERFKLTERAASYIIAPQCPSGYEQIASLFTGYQAKDARDLKGHRFWHTPDAVPFPQFPAWSAFHPRLCAKK